MALESAGRDFGTPTPLHGAQPAWRRQPRGLRCRAAELREHLSLSGHRAGPSLVEGVAPRSPGPEREHSAPRLVEWHPAAGVHCCDPSVTPTRLSLRGLAALRAP